MDAPKFEKRLKFRDAAQLREAVWSHSIKHDAPFIKLKRNEKWKISARCEKNCPWRLYASRMYNEDSIQVKTYVGKHECPRIWRENPNCKVAWLVKRYMDKFKLNPSMPITTFMETVKEERMVEIDIKIAYRVRAQCLKILEGSNLDQYTKLWEYCDELRKTNPGSTVQMKVMPYDDAHVIFQRIYICLGACKNGFKNGCRKLVGLDGCHLKGVFKGQLLSAVGMDANNQTWVIAYAIVELKNKDNWVWFLKLLAADLGIVNQRAWTFISDKQKGLIPAFEKVLPNCNHRFCVRHLYTNYKADVFKGKRLKYVLWNAAKATTIDDFKESMAEVNRLNEKAYKWLEKRPTLH
ncbi:uncharacterized protein [Malus domestica]|uniref:uncharacterized protein n=1 Tax=Malus domestica TaxID=3750 RepID=UPI0010AAC39B|nr:uncharacterized protein LOC114826364 [Malus domestica]